MEKAMTIKITTEDRKGADFESSSNCPLGRALRRMHPKALITVFNNKVYMNAVKYTFNEGLYNEGVLQKKKGDISVTLIQTVTNATTDTTKTSRVERIK